MKIGSEAWSADRRAASKVRYPWFGRMLESQPIRFLVVGGLSTTVNWTSRLFLSLVLGFEVSVASAYAIGMVVGFVAYRNWVFEGSAVPLRRQLMFFVLVNAVGLAVVTSMAKATLSLLLMMHLLPVGLAEDVAHGSALALAAFVNFLGHRSLSFARRLSIGPTAADA